MTRYNHQRILGWSGSITAGTSVVVTDVEGYRTSPISVILFAHIIAPYLPASRVPATSGIRRRTLADESSFRPQRNSILHNPTIRTELTRSAQPAVWRQHLPEGREIDLSCAPRMRERRALAQRALAQQRLRLAARFLDSSSFLLERPKRQKVLRSFLS